MTVWLAPLQTHMTHTVELNLLLKHPSFRGLCVVPATSLWNGASRVEKRFVFCPFALLCRNPVTPLDAERTNVTAPGASLTVVFGCDEATSRSSGLPSRHMTAA